MKKIFCLLLVLGFCSGLHAQKEKFYKSHLHDPGTDDFKSTTSEFLFSDKVKLAYCISNDDENIYVDLLIANTDVQRQVMNSGITIWISNDGKKTKKMGVRYPVRDRDNQARERPAMARNTPPPGNQQGATRFTQEKPDGGIQLLGFSESGPVTISSSEEGNIRGSIRIERDRNMYYEIILPLSKLPELNDLPVGKEKQGSFLIGIAYPEIPVAPSYGAPSGGQRMPGGGGRPGGGGGGGMRPPSGSAGSSQQSQTQTIFWIQDIRLASRN
ncbi:MAG TPA: hypothetical protein PLR52_07005 [Bacteroidales bacterium]|nr:hypothetical protein [Bacteroidales bacterium]HPF02948.1 hypothetical protein [Bacteroidales bacterium]HPJ58426.1 hypothetical protein [Bacteroidales bacterium]HPR73127.1 hypothetical protein [Bacteroidales bacterium]HRW85184.1 hypothetical protein [Bacteroidales bacterium]